MKSESRENVAGNMHVKLKNVTNNVSQDEVNEFIEFVEFKAYYNNAFTGFINTLIIYHL